MSTEAVTVEELLKKGEADFDSFVKSMPAKNLMDFISRLQKEMTKEQESFNSLNAELQNRKERNSRQSKQISKDMVLSQQRLTLLMNRSMKCFAQQNVTPSKQGTQLVRRNSAKGSQPVISPSQKPATNVHRSRSMHVINKLNDSTTTPVKNDPSPSSKKVGVSNEKMMGVSGTTVSSNQHQPIIKYNVNGTAPPNLATIGGGGRSIIAKASSHGNLANPNPGAGDKQGTSSSVRVSGINNSGGGGVVKNSGDGGGGSNGRLERSTTSAGTTVPVASSSSFSASSARTLSSTTANEADAGGGGTGGGGGMYVKRKQGSQANKVTVTPLTSLPPRATSSSSYTTLSSNSSSSSSSPASSGGVVVLKSSFNSHSKPRPASMASSLSPLQVSRTRPGVSHSQIIGQEAVTSDLSNDGGQGRAALPSVKMLAKSFGSSTALHLTPASSSSSSNPSDNGFNRSDAHHAHRTTSVVLSNRSLAPRSSTTTTTTTTSSGSSSNINIVPADDLTKRSRSASYSNSVSFTKGNNNTAAVGAVPASTTTTTHVNGKTSAPSQQQQQRQPNGTTHVQQQRTSVSGSKDSPSELDLARSRLKSNRLSAEILNETSNSSFNNVGESAVAATTTTTTTSSSTSEADVEAAKQKEQRIAENTRVGTYIKKGGTQQGNTSSQLPSSSSSSTSAAKPTLVTISSSKVNSNSNNNNSKPPTSTTPSSASSTTSTSSSSKEKTPSVNIASISSSKTNGSSAASSGHVVVVGGGKSTKVEPRSGGGGGAQVKKPVADRSSLLKQIESRRADYEEGGPSQNGGAFKSSAKLSASLPSLVVFGGLTSGHVVPLWHSFRAVVCSCANIATRLSQDYDGHGNSSCQGTLATEPDPEVTFGRVNRSSGREGGFF